MAKKKNRKKELKRQQKLDIKVMTEQEAEVYEEMQTRPVFVQARYIPHFDRINTALSQLLEEGEDKIEELDMLALQEDLKAGRFKWRKDHTLFQEAMVTPQTGKRRKLLQRVLAENPDYFLAELHLWLADFQPGDLYYLKRSQDFYAYTHQKWRDNGYGDWYDFSSRPYLTALRCLVEYFCEEGLYHQALEIVELVNNKRPERFPVGFVVLMLSVYNYTGHFGKIEQFYKMRCRVYGKGDDTVLVHLIVARVLQGRLQEAEQLFEELSQINPDTLSFFSDWAWLSKLVEIEEEEVFLSLSAQSLASHLEPLLDLFNTCPILVHFFMEQAVRLGGDDALREDDEPFLEGLSLFELCSFPEFQGIRFSTLRVFYHEGLMTAEDFQEKTEKEVLALKGIGAKTIEQLKKNGIVFKDSK